MVDFLTAKKAAAEIESIISEAKTDGSIILITPYVKIPDDLISRLRQAARLRNVHIKVICRKDDLRPDQRATIEEIQNLELLFNERVHAKCFYNQDSMVITSLNLYDSSAGENREMGVLLRSNRESDKEAFLAAKNEAEFISSESEPGTKSTLKAKFTENIRSNKPAQQFKSAKENSIGDQIVEGLSSILGIEKEEKGHCIHCGEEIPLKLEAPYCLNCYRTWAKNKDEDRKERYCIKCGIPYKTSMKRPLCLSCYNRSK
jgi:RNA polymerase-binding transcription factor DksA